MSAGPLARPRAFPPVPLHSLIDICYPHKCLSLRSGAHPPLFEGLPAKAGWPLLRALALRECLPHTSNPAANQRGMQFVHRTLATQPPKHRQTCHSDRSGGRRSFFLLRSCEGSRGPRSGGSLLLFFDRSRKPSKICFFKPFSVHRILHTNSQSPMSGEDESNRGKQPHAPRGPKSNSKSHLSPCPGPRRAGGGPAPRARSGPRSEPARREDLALEPSDLAQPPGQQVRGSGPSPAAAARMQPSRLCGVTMAAPQHPAGAGLGRGQQPGVVQPRRHHDHALDPAPPQRPDLADRLVVHVVHHDDGASRERGSLVHQLDAVAPELAGTAVADSGSHAATKTGSALEQARAASIVMPTCPCPSARESESMTFRQSTRTQRPIHIAAHDGSAIV